MAKPEDVAPWRASRLSQKEPYPRKNVYFSGANADEIYDYCTWRANIRGYRTLSGVDARNTADLINDVLRRAYLKDMLDEDLLEDFQCWRRHEYQNAGLDPKDAALAFPINAYLADDETRLAEKRLESFLRRVSTVARTMRIAIWKTQNGNCAICLQPRRLLVHRPARSRLAEAERLIDAKMLKRLRSAFPAEASSDLLLGLCRSCARHAPDAFVNLDVTRQQFAKVTP